MLHLLLLLILFLLLLWLLLFIFIVVVVPLVSFIIFPVLFLVVFHDNDNVLDIFICNALADAAVLVVAIVVYVAAIFNVFVVAVDVSLFFGFLNVLFGVVLVVSVFVVIFLLYLFIVNHIAFFGYYWLL